VLLAFRCYVYATSVANYQRCTLTDMTIGILADYGATTVPMIRQIQYVAMVTAGARGNSGSLEIR